MDTWRSLPLSEVESLLGILQTKINGTKAPDNEAQQWVTQIGECYYRPPTHGRLMADETLKAQKYHQSKTIIAVVGNTGAGKPSLLNAFLDEERLLPSSGMRVCTAVITEISYSDADPHYRAEVEFISADEWAHELAVLKTDLVTANGSTSSEVKTDGIEANVASRKIQAIYPDRNLDNIIYSELQSLLQELNDRLGTTLNLEGTEAVNFSGRLAAFVDSGSTPARLKNNKSTSLWPLVRMVMYESLKATEMQS